MTIDKERAAAKTRLHKFIVSGISLPNNKSTKKELEEFNSRLFTEIEILREDLILLLIDKL